MLTLALTVIISLGDDTIGAISIEVTLNLAGAGWAKVDDTDCEGDAVEFDDAGVIEVVGAAVAGTEASVVADGGVSLVVGDVSDTFGLQPSDTTNTKQTATKIHCFITKAIILLQ